MGEDIESVRPAYDYAKTQARLEELEGTIRRLKHAINRFNTTQVVDGFGITIDEMLVYIPQLTKRKSKLLEMKSRLPKERVEEQYGRQSNIIDYTYTNYDLAAIYGLSIPNEPYSFSTCTIIILPPLLIWRSASCLPTSFINNFTRSI